MQEFIPGMEDGLPHLPMPRKTPFLIHTNIYSTPGTAGEAVASLADYPEAAALLRSEFAYQRGDLEQIYADANYFLRAHSGFNAIVSAGALLSRCAMWRGDVELWKKARRHLFEAPCESDDQRQVLAFWIAAVDSGVHDTASFPEWFRQGMFSLLPADAFSSARMFYVKYLFIAAHDLAKGSLQLADVEGLGLMRTLPHFIEPMISQAQIEHTLLPEIYLRLMAAVVYHNLGRDEQAIPHLDRAIALCLPDKLYTALVEFRTQLDSLLDERLALADGEALRSVKSMHLRMMEGWTRLHNHLLSRSVTNAFTPREREVAKLAVFGYSNAEIARRLHIEVSSVKRHLFSAMNKVGAEKRAELGLYI